MQRAIENEADSLFESLSVDEVRARIAAVRREIGSKKQDLRAYIGENYRELVNVADAVLHLSRVSDSLKQSVSASADSHSELARWRVGSSSQREVAAAGKPVDVEDDSSAIATARRMRVVVEAPDAIAVALESDDFVTAAEAYFSARHAFARLDSTAMEGAPIVRRQWIALGTAPERISRASWDCLGGCRAGVPSARACGLALAAIMLVECVTPAELFRRLVKARLDASLASASSSSAHSSGVLDSLSAFTANLCLTLHLADVLFCTQQQQQQQQTAAAVTGLEPCMLVTLARPFCTKPSTPPETVAVLREAGVGHGTALVPWDDVKSACEKWVGLAVNESAALVSAQLARVTTARDLAGIARALQARLAAPCDGVGPWRQVCVRALGADLDPWMSFFDKPFSVRAKEVIASHFTGSVETLASLLDARLQCATAEDSNLGQWVWSPHPTATTAAATAVVGRSTLQQAVSLRCSLVQTPTLAELVRWTEDRFRGILGDLSAIVPFDDIDDDQPAVKSTGATPTPTPFTRKEKELRAVVRDCLAKALSWLSEKLRQRLEDADLGRMLFVGRLAHGVAFGVTNLGRLAGTEALDRLPLSAARLELCGVYATSLARWVVPTVASLVASFKERLAAEDWQDTNRKATWEGGFAVADEDSASSSASTEEGGGCEKAELPTQTTAALWSLVLSAAHAIVSASSHTLPRQVVQQLARRVSSGALEAYAALCSPSPPGVNFPMEALVQLWFDVCFLGDVFASRIAPAVGPRAGDLGQQQLAAALQAAFRECNDDDRWGERVSVVVASIQKRMDPVDSEFFKPRMRSALARCYARSSIFLSFFMSSGSGVTFAAPKPARPGTSTAQEGQQHQQQHSTLPLAKPAPRFGLLPTPSTQESAKKQRSISPPIAGINQLSQSMPLPVSHHERSASLGKRVFGFLS